MKTEPFTVFFLSILVLSFFWHANFRNKHFQECDSAGTYNMIYDFPASGLKYAAISYPEGNILSPQNAEKILQNPTVLKIKEKFFAKYSNELIINKLTKLNLLAIIRYGYIQGVAMLRLPHQLLGFFAVPLSSTYSAGPGLMYTLISGPTTSYENFMSRALLLNIFIFHISVLFLYLTLRKLKIQNIIAVVSSLLLLFSISFYSSGYHLGSTLWIFFSEILLLLIIVNFWGKDKFLKILSIITGILVYFDYLIIFLWVAILLTVLLQRISNTQKKLKDYWQNSVQIIKSQVIGIVLIFICGIVFFQPGQSARGSTSLKTLPSDFYYTVLNFFSLYTHSQIINLIQFILGIIIILTALVYLFKKNTEALTPERLAIKHILAFFTAITAVLILIKILNFVPTRHILFLMPVWLFGLALALDNVKNKKVVYYLGTLVILLLCTASAYSLPIRQADTLDRTAQITLPSDLQEAGIYDCSYNLVNRSWNSQVPVNFIDPKTFEANKNFLYLSQVVPFDIALKNWREQYNISVEVLSKKELNNPVYFVAFNPDITRFLYSRPNSLYETKFKVISITKK